MCCSSGSRCFPGISCSRSSGDRFFEAIRFSKEPLFGASLRSSHSAGQRFSSAGQFCWAILRTIRSKLSARSPRLSGGSGEWPLHFARFANNNMVHWFVQTFAWRYVIQFCSSLGLSLGPLRHWRATSARCGLPGKLAERERTSRA